MAICITCGAERLVDDIGECASCAADTAKAGQNALDDREAPARAPEEFETENDSYGEESDSYDDGGANTASDQDPETHETNPEKPGSLKEAATNAAAGAIVGEKNLERAKQMDRFIAKSRVTASRVAWASKGAVTVLASPATWISLLAIILIFIISNFTVTTYQTIGSMKEEGAGAGMANEVIERLAQRGTLLAQTAYQHSNSDAFVSAHGGDPRTNGNPWAAACPDIVNIIYGMPELYIGNNGIDNAYQNYKRLIAGGLTAQSWWFPETSSPGAARDQPPAGAIVSATGSGPAGHTYVVLTDDGKVIDNTWSIHSGGPATNGGYRTLDDGSRAGIRGWFLPPAEGYEGTFLNDDPMLPPVPEWAMGQGGSSGGGAATVPAGSAQQIASTMVKARGWGDDQFTCLVKLWTRESSWRVNAMNASSGAYGIPQSLPGNKMASAGSDWKTNPATQIKWGLDYIKSRYGNPCGAWGHSESTNPHWY